MPWSPNIPAALLIFGSALGLYAMDLPAWWRGRRFWSAEKRKLENVERWWTERAREMQ
jgi:hypothetical protein